MAAASGLRGHQDEPLGPSVAPGSVAQPLLHPHVSSRVTVPPAATPRRSHWDSVPWAHGPHRGAGGAQVPLLAGADALACECRLFGVHSAPSSREWDEARALRAGTGQAECSRLTGDAAPTRLPAQHWSGELWPLPPRRPLASLRRTHLGVSSASPWTSAPGRRSSPSGPSGETANSAPVTLDCFHGFQQDGPGRRRDQGPSCDRAG